jgi:hypothetical protein
MFKKLFTILIFILFSAIPALSQDNRYQDLLDCIQQRHPAGIPQMPVMTPGTGNNIAQSAPKEIVVHLHHHYDTYDLLKMQSAAPPEPAQNNSSPGWYDYMLFSDSLMQANEILQRSLYPPYPPPYYPPSVYDMRHGYVPPSGCCQYPW